MSMGRKVWLPRSGRGEYYPSLLFDLEERSLLNKKLTVDSHRWNHEIKEWVKMSKDEEQRAKKAAVERKLEELKAKERSEPIQP
jgi:predicted Fe-S protein YdhL (DUF1289 family)